METIDSNKFVTTGSNIALLKKVVGDIAPKEVDTFVFENTVI